MFKRPRSSATCGAQPGRAKRGPAARSAAPREARPPPKAAGAGGAPELREGRIRKLEAIELEAIQLPRPNADSCFSGFVGTARQVFDDLGCILTIILNVQENRFL